MLLVYWMFSFYLLRRHWLINDDVCGVDIHDLPWVGGLVECQHLRLRGCESSGGCKWAIKWASYRWKPLKLWIFRFLYFCELEETLFAMTIVRVLHLWLADDISSFNSVNYGALLSVHDQRSTWNLCSWSILRKVFLLLFAVIVGRL